MLKIMELKSLVNAAEESVESAEDMDSAIEVLCAAEVAYFAEHDAAMALKTKYVAMCDEDAIGCANAGDTYGPEYGDIRFISTEYWNCAIGSYQLMLDSDPVKMRHEPAVALADADMAVCEGVYFGLVLSVADEIVTQKTNRDGATTLHDLRALSMPVAAGDVIGIKYTYGVGVVSGKELSAGVGR